MRNPQLNIDLRWTDIGEQALNAFWFASVADLPAVVDHPMWKHYPMFSGDKFGEIGFDLFRGFVRSKAEPLRDA